VTGYIAALACFALVLSPLFIPIAVTIVHWIRTARENRHRVKPSVETPRTAPAPRLVRRAEPA
jgi:hypothetical protein